MYADLSNSDRKAARLIGAGRVWPWPTRTATDRREDAAIYLAVRFAVLIILFSNVTPISGQVLEGRVIDAGSGAPIAVASVSVLRDERALFDGTSDSLGRFRMALPAAGDYSLRVARLGYDTFTTNTIHVGRNHLVELEVRLGVSPIPLNSVVITSRRVALRLRSEYYRRLDAARRTGFGDFITRADLESLQLPFLSSYVARIPGVTLWTDPITYKTHPLVDRDCRPAIYMNGVAIP